jgi:alkylhydroperoxidase family enzyme
VSSVPRTAITLADAAPELAAAQARFQKVAYPGKVDLVTRELLRILSGRLSHCSICQSLRLQAAIDRGFDESMVEHLESPARSGLPESQQVVLRLALASLTGSPFTDSDWAQLRSYYSGEQLAELILDLVRFRPGSKLTVAAGREPVLDGLVYA